MLHEFLLVSKSTRDVSGNMNWKIKSCTRTRIYDHISKRSNMTTISCR
ncbi:hypothetical protein HanIR_Chr07g0314911 [Helianthus annuus]|nr:hypothetical protein HanIR_Chr07g0314911 [Helianthus annuus]